MLTEKVFPLSMHSFSCHCKLVSHTSKMGKGPHTGEVQACFSLSLSFYVSHGFAIMCQQNRWLCWAMYFYHGLFGLLSS